MKLTLIAIPLINHLKTISFVVGFMHLALLTGCRNNSSTADAVNINAKAQDSLQLINLIPDGYTLLDSQLVDLDQDSVKEYLLYFKTTNHTPCDMDEITNCFLNEILIAKKVDNTWTERYRFLLQRPLPTDSINRMFVDFKNPNLLTVTSSYRPTCCSGIHTTQYYHFEKNQFLLDSLNHYVSTKSGHESYSWDYTIDILRKMCHFSSDYLDPENDKSSSSQFVYDLKIEKTPTILSKNSIEDFVPKDSLKHWY